MRLDFVTLSFVSHARTVGIILDVMKQLFFLSMCIEGRWILSGGAGVHMWNLQLKYYIEMNYVHIHWTHNFTAEC